MREDICSIPISEIFEPKDGCPFCRMRDMLEDRMATYITGAAMMEPDVRVETNRLGFCHQHFEQILQRGSRLSVALILESLLDEAGKEILPEDDKLAPKKILAAADRGFPSLIESHIRFLILGLLVIVKLTLPQRHGYQALAE